MAPGERPPSLLGEFIRAQRQMANLSLRQLSAMAQVSNPYLSQVERGIHEPSVRVLRAIAEALNLSAETLLVQAGLLSRTPSPDPGATAAAIMADGRLSPAQRRALLAVYRSYVDVGSDDLLLLEPELLDPDPLDREPPGRPTRRATA